MHSWSIFALVTLCAYGLCCADSSANFTRISINSTDSITGYSARKGYIINYAKLNWYNAWLTCRERGSYLASFRDRWELRQLSNELKLMNFNDMPYIDGSSLAQRGNFRWYSNALPVSADLFDKGKPDNPKSRRCLVLSYKSKREYLINNVSCDDKHYFICQV